MTRILLHGGYVHAPTDPHASALCIDSGVIVWTGDDDAAVHFADNADRVVDLGGRLVTPAFVDAHAHLAQTGFAATGVDLNGAASLHDALDRVSAHARATTAAVLLGFGWDETMWPEHRAFTREELDRATDGRPAFLSRVDVHSAVLSTAFLDACPQVTRAEGYDASGRVLRDAHHVARTGLFALQPQADREEAILHALRAAAGAGIGMVHEMGAPHICPPRDLETLAALSEAVAIGKRPALPEVERYWGSLDVAQAQALGCTGAAGDLCMDGSIGSHTSALHKPFADAQTSGHLYLDAAQVTAHVIACTDAQIQAGFHVIGDRAGSEVVAGFRAAAEVLGAAAVVQGRHRLEHVEIATTEEMTVLGSLGVTASMQPMFDALWGGEDGVYAQRLGVDRARSMNAWASMSKVGVPLAFGSDTPVTPFAPWAGVRAAAWHHTETERITARAAFNAHTRGGWRAARRDDGGVIALGAPGSIAVWDVPGDLVVQTPDARVAAWSTDPRAGVPQLPDLHPDVDLPTCVLTLVGGEVAFEESGALT
ncbi:MAG TPA: amidohydrolase family protein [Nocardioidaceae bacterium]|nr:amidohydrolase family protein [Nocardioidaceae bacterium]